MRGDLFPTTRLVSLFSVVFIVPEERRRGSRACLEEEETEQRGALRWCRADKKGTAHIPHA